MAAKLIAVCAGVLCGLSVATAVFAYTANLAPALGPPLWRQSIFAFYAPWDIVRWAWWWAGAAPKAFQLPALVGVLLAGMTACKTWPRSPRTTQPQAHWANGGELKAAELLGEEGQGIVVGKRGRRVLRYSGQGHIFAVGSTGSGKTACLISTLLEYPHSLFVHDPKDSLWAKTAGYRATLGKVVRLAPMDLDTEGYDPLAAIRLGSDDEYPDVATVVRFLTNPEGKKNRDDTSEHFQELVNLFAGGVLLYGLHSGIATTCAEMNDLVTRTHWPDLLAVMRTFDHPEVQRAAEIVSRIADRELSGVQTTAARAFQIFADPRVARMTSQQSFTLADLREAEAPCTVYYSVPFADMERLRPLSRLILRQVLGHATSRLTGWTHRLLVAVDELPSLDRLAILSDALNFAREFGVQLYCLTPSMEEVVGTYGTHHPFLEGTYVQLVYGLLDPDVARRFSRRVGAQKTRRTQTTVQHGGRGGSSTSTSDHDEPLFSETHILKMRRESVLIAAGHTTVLAEQARYYTTQSWRARSEIPPPRREEVLA